MVLEFKYSKMILPTKLKTHKNEIGWIESGVNNKRYFLMPLTMLLDKVPEGFDINNMKCNIIVKMVKKKRHHPGFRRWFYPDDHAVGKQEN